MIYAAEAKGLTKIYGNQRALDGVALALEPNRVYGLLGRNGAGKTTLMHILTAQLFATSGEVKVFGSTPYENAEVLSRVCFIKESQKYPDLFRVSDVLRFAESVYPNWSKETAAELLQQFKLPLRKRIKQLSRGMRSSVGIIVGLASRAELTLFDEPYLGLDAVARSIFYNSLIAEQAEHPRTVVLSTHLIEEASMLLEHVFLIDQGRLLLDEDAESLRTRAYHVAGPVAKVEAFCRNRTILSRQPLGGYLQAAVLAEPQAEGIAAAAAAAGLEASPVHLQQLVVYMTEAESAYKEGRT